MELNNLLSVSTIKVSLNGTTHQEVLKELSHLLSKSHNISNEEDFFQDIMERENDLSTVLENGIAIPHAKSSNVLKSGIAIGISKDGIQCGAQDNQLTHIFIMIASKTGDDEEHLRSLSGITSKLLNKSFREQLLQASTNQEVFDLFLAKEIDQVKSTANNPNQPFYIGVTGCPVGVAHTYLAAKSLQQRAAQFDISIKVETNGSIGVENEPTSEEIRKAQVIIIASDKQVDMDRFKGKRVIFSSTKEAIDHPEIFFEREIEDIPIYHGNSNETNNKKTTNPQNGLYSYLMNGVSFMIPFVVVGGLLIAIALTIGGEPTAAGLVIPEDSFWNQILQIGVVGFTLMIPILAGYIAYAIGDRAAFAPGMIGGWIANNGSFYNADAGTGFIGAIVAGLLVGYLVRFIKKIKVPKFMEPLMPILVIPIVATLVISFVFIFIIGAPISSLMTALFTFLTSLSGGSIILLGLIMGLMQGFDMGGPFGKVVFLFSVGLIGSGQTQFMGAQACAIPVAPLGMALATFLGKNLFDEEERANGKTALAMGLVGISEGAIPFAASDPLAVIPANMIGSAVACILGFLFGVTDAVAHGGPIVALLGAMNKPLLGLLAMAAGTIVTAIITLTLKKILRK